MRKTIIAMLLALPALTPAYGQRLVVGKGQVDCGKVAFQKPVTAVFELRNKGSRRLKIEDVKVSCGCVAAEYPKGEIEGGERFKLKLTYDAKQLGHFEKTAGIYSNGSKKPVYLKMTGVVLSEVLDFSGSYPFEIGSLRVDKRDLEFDDVNKGDRPVQELYVINTGTATLTPNLMHLPPYLSATVEPEQLRPNHPGKITVTLNSAKIPDFGLTQTSIYLGGKLGEKISADNEISVSAVLLPGFVGMSRAQKQYAPKMQLSAETLNINFDGKSKRKGEITITNAGRTGLKITSLQMFTAGLRVTLSKSEIEPGGEAKLKITAVAEDIKKLRTKPRVLMITNDPDRPKVVININAK